MSLPPSLTYTDLDVVLPVFVGIGLLMSAFRLTHRIRTRRFGWDDAFCIVSVCNTVAGLAFFFVFVQPPSYVSHQGMIIAQYGAAIGFEGAIWMARVSLVLTIVRLAAFVDQKRRLCWLAGFFVFIYLFLVAQWFWICETQPGWKELPLPECELGKQRSITELICDVTSDIALLIIPLRMLSKSSLDKPVRLRLIVLFSTSILLTVVSVVQDVMVFVSGGLREIFTSELEMAFALIVCNVVVVATALYRKTLPAVRDTPDSQVGSSQHPDVVHEEWSIGSLHGQGTTLGGGIFIQQTTVCDAHNSIYRLDPIGDAAGGSNSAAQSVVDVKSIDCV